MTNRIHLFLYTLLILALLIMTGAAAFLFGQMQRQNSLLNTPLSTLNSTNSSGVNDNSALLNKNSSSQPTNPLTEHDTWITFSADPTSFVEGRLIKESASVPDIMVCQPEIQTSACSPNEFLVYYVDATTLTSPGTEQIGVIRSTDGGETWSEVEHIDIEGQVNQGAAVDPSVVQLPDGRVRLYYFGSETTQGDPASTSGAHKVYSAISTDGVHFTHEEGERLAVEKLTDPEVVEWNDTWYMLYSVGTNSGLAVSSDGLNFEDKGTLSPSFGGVPGLLATDDKLIGYGCQMGIAGATSTDGETFTKLSSLVLDLQGGSALCDPALDFYGGEYVMVYKTAPIQALGQQQQQPGNQNFPEGGQNQNLPPLNSNTQKE